MFDICLLLPGPARTSSYWVSGKAKGKTGNYLEYLHLRARYREILRNYLIYAGDGLPALICHRCLYQVERSFEFKEQCEHSDATLRQYLKRQHIGDTCQVVTIKQETVQEDSSQDAENSMLHFVSDCGTARGDKSHVKQEEDAQHNQSSQEKTANVESVVVNVDPYQMDVKEQTDAQDIQKLSLPGAVFMRNKESFEVNVLADGRNLKPFLCEVCFKSFSDRAYLRTHMQLHTGVRAHRCNLCSKAFVRRRELLRHEKVHSGERPFGCSACGKRFSRRDKLTRHEKIHAEQRHHSCELCPATFLRSDELARHAMCHTGERPWCCPICYKSFFSKAELNRHSKTHADIKPYKCDLCAMAFCRKDKLTRHRNTHSRNKRYMYNFCAVPYSKNDSLGLESDQKDISNLKQLPSPYVESISLNRKEDEEEREEDPDISLSRLGQNPEILLFPIPHQ
ncbi:zinc finger protein 32-like isoform X2 [Zootermopsis nevadensis]|uniref:zinc finger protein 32-like isoform X2 n=1 Tax=Zootermopsis nevadensis TaxID=136037 RepID=UPI000B8E3379|nr:zinc finger protein 32-like isoform X2 [Zootermopsis nevadensis]